MGLLIYSAPDPSAAFSVSGQFTNPLSMAFDGILGSTVNRRYYVRNDASDRYYTGITVKPVYSSGDAIIDGTDGFGWKLYAGDSQPLEDQWDLLSYANTISVPDIGTAVVADTATYEPFWLRIVVPKGASVKSHSGIKLRLEYTESLIP